MVSITLIHDYWLHETHVCTVAVYYLLYETHPKKMSFFFYNYLKLFTIQIQLMSGDKIFRLIPTWKQTINFLVIWFSEERNHLDITQIRFFKCRTQPYIFTNWYLIQLKRILLTTTISKFFLSTEQSTTCHQSLLQYECLLHQPKLCQKLIRTSTEQKWVSRDRRNRE